MIALNRGVLLGNECHLSPSFFGSIDYYLGTLSGITHEKYFFAKMTTFEFLKEEFDNFINNYEKKENFNLETPPLELEAIEQVKFDTKIELNKLKTVILPSLSTRNNVNTESLEAINSIRPVKIKYLKPQKRYGQFKFKLTTKSTNYPAMNCKILSIPTLKRENSFKDLQIFSKIETSEILLSNPLRNASNFKSFLTSLPNVEKGTFGINLMPVNLNPIAPKFVKDISYRDVNRNLLLNSKLTAAFEAIKEVKIAPLNEFPCDFMIEEEKSEEFQKRCVLNATTLKNDLLIEALQSNQWLIYERLDKFKDIQMIQVNKSQILLLIRIEQLKNTLDTIDIIKSTNDACAIIEIDDSR